MNVVKATNAANMEAASTEFTRVEMYLPNKLAATLKEVKDLWSMANADVNELFDLIRAEIPDPVRLHVGMSYAYVPNDGGRTNVYQIVNLGEVHAIVRRMNSNRAGNVGSKLATTKKKIISDIQSGTAYIVNNEPIV